MTQEELKLVFNALKQCSTYAFAGGLGVRATAHTDALAILEKALAQPEQEPVAWRTPKLSNLHGKYGYRDFNDPVIDISTGKPSLHNEPLYLTPPQPKQEPVADDFFRMIADKNPKPFPLPQRKFVGLTDEEIDAIYTGVRAVHHEINSDLFARAIESKLKDKNS